MKQIVKLKLPSLLIESISENIINEKAFFNLNEKQKQSLNKKLINLWYFIFSKQVKDTQNSLKFFINLHCESFRSFKIKINKKEYQYNELLNLLEKWRLIEINHKYCNLKLNQSNQIFSKSYRIKTEFLSGSKMSEVEIDFTKIFNNNKNKEYWLKKYPKYTNLIEDSYNTTIKLDEFINWLYSNIGIDLKKLKLTKGSLKTTFLTPERITFYTNNVLKFYFKNLWFKVSNEGRFYSSITNLPSVCIRYLQLYDKDLIELDVKNCQPLLLASFVNHPKFQKDVEKGIFYEKMGKKMNLESKIFKLLSYKFIFFTNNKLKKGRFFDAINSCYPNLIEQINNLKNEKNLALILQKFESSIFIEKIGMLPFNKLTRHDSVLVFEENQDFFKKMIENEFNNYNLKVTVKIKNYS